MTTIRVCVTDSKKKITRTTTTQKPTQFDRGKEDKTPNHMRFDTCVCVCVCVCYSERVVDEVEKGGKRQGFVPAAALQCLPFLCAPFEHLRPSPLLPPYARVRETPS